jgi:site-specific DNA-methyltransferase (adenine-specific)
MKPYFEDAGIVLYHADSFEVMATLENDSIDAVITDPPYAEYVHKNAKSNRNKGHGNQAIDFQHFTQEDLFRAFEEFGRLAKSWVVSTIAFEHAYNLAQLELTNLEMKRIGVWVKTNPMPQISADRPAHGWEAIAYLHKKNKKSVWNGGGNHGNYISALATPTGHPTPKPLAMLTSMVERFTNQHALSLDPFAGGGTTLLAARNLSRRAIGIEIDEKYCELIANRLSQTAFDFEGI